MTLFNKNSCINCFILSFKNNVLFSVEQMFPMSSLIMFQSDRRATDKSKNRRLENRRLEKRRQEFLSLNVQTLVIEGERPSVPSADVPTHSKIFLDFETV
jgi:hypothetical protein